MSDNYGTGFYGFKARIEAIASALGGLANVRLAVSESFRKSLSDIIQARPRAPGDYSWTMFDWTTASDTEFDDAGGRTERYWAREPQGVVIATAPWGGRELQLRQDNVTLAGDGYWMPVARIMETKGYSARSRQNETKWSPYLTDEGCYAALGSKYSSDAKNTSTKTAAAAHVSLRKLVEKFFKVSFTNVEEDAA